MTAKVLHLPFVLGCLSVLALAQDLTPSEWLWAIKTDSTLRLRQIPNYTCLETISVGSRSARAGAREETQQTQVQVAMIGGRELYSEPGAHRFQRTAPPELPLPRFTTIGLYFSLARGLMSEASQEQQLVSRQNDRLQYRFAARSAVHAWKIHFNNKTAEASKNGTFSADAGDHLLRRVTLEAADITPDIGLAGLHLAVDYEPTELAGKKVLLPVVADVTAVEKNKTVYRSHMEFKGCRAFAAESNLFF